MKIAVASFFAFFVHYSDGYNLPTPNQCVATSYVDENHVVGGSRAGLWPWMGKIQYKNNPSNGDERWAFLISHRHMLTWQFYNDSTIRNLKAEVLLGKSIVEGNEIFSYYWTGYPKKNDENKQQIYGIEKIINHEEYHVSIIKLNRSVIFNDYVKPLCLPFSPEMRTNDFVNAYVRVPQWRFMQIPCQYHEMVLYETTLKVWSNEKCREYEFEFDTNDTISCVGPIRGIVSDNRGFPAVYNIGKASYAIGISTIRAWSTPTTAKSKGLERALGLIRINSLVDWIQKHLGENDKR